MTSYDIVKGWDDRVLHGNRTIRIEALYKMIFTRSRQIKDMKHETHRKIIGKGIYQVPTRSERDGFFL